MTSRQYRRMLVVTAVDAERTAAVEGLRTVSDLGQPGEPARTACQAITVATVGVGPYAAAAGTARLLARAEASGAPYQSVLCAGIAGGFPDRVGVGDLVVATSCVAADLGIDDLDGFISIDRLGFGPTVAATDPALLAAVRVALPGAAFGTVLTVSTATGTAERATALLERHPQAMAEAMEGFGVATAAAAAGAAFGELRAISNPVGPRDRAAWQIPAALTALGTALAAVGHALGDNRLR